MSKSQSPYQSKMFEPFWPSCNKLCESNALLRSSQGNNTQTCALTMMRQRAFPVLGFLLATCFSARADDLADLIKRVPGEMNTVAVVNVREINRTPRAVREKWREHQEAEYLAGAMAVPSFVSVVVIGAELHPGDLSHGRAKGKNYSRSALFFDNYAARVEKLSIQDIDPLLVQYGTRKCSRSTRSTSISTSVRGRSASEENEN